MLFTDDRSQLRRFFCQAWQKYRCKETVQPLEKQIGEIVAIHPEYQTLLENEALSLEMDCLPELGESNPFLHLSMHLAIREQLNSGQPAGIVKIYRTLLATLGDPHEVEHRMMECLAKSLWQAQHEGTAPDESGYMRCLKTIVNPAT